MAIASCTTDDIRCGVAHCFLDFSSGLAKLVDALLHVIHRTFALLAGQGTSEVRLYH